MSIISIPSKKIYSAKLNKYADNKVFGVSLELQSFTTEEKVEEAIYEGTPQFYIDQQEEQSHSKLNIFSPEVQDAYRHEVTYTSLKLSYAKIHLVLPKIIGMRHITKIKTEENFSYRLIGTETKADCTSNEMSVAGNKTYENPDFVSFNLSNSNISEDVFYEIQKTENGKVEVSYGKQTLISFDDKTKMEYIDSGTEYIFDFLILCSAEIVKMDGEEALDVDADYYFEGKINGEYLKQEAKRIELQILGNEIVIEVSQNNKVYGETDDAQQFSVSNNENLHANGKVGDKSLGQHIADTIIDIYKDGKQTAVIKCGIGEYRDENGDLAISTKVDGIPMHFGIYDVVQPYVMDERGEDVPLAKKNGLPCNFLVLGRKFIYDGEVMQELYLQEE